MQESTSPSEEVTVYEVWGDAESGIGTLISTPSNIEHMRVNGLVEDELTPLYSIRGTWNQAMTYHHEHNGWEPYKPFTY